MISLYIEITEKYMRNLVINKIDEERKKYFRTPLHSLYFRKSAEKGGGDWAVTGACQHKLKRGCILSQTSCSAARYNGSTLNLYLLF